MTCGRIATNLQALDASWFAEPACLADRGMQLAPLRGVTMLRGRMKMSASRAAIALGVLLMAGAPLAEAQRSGGGSHGNGSHGNGSHGGGGRSGGGHGSS